MKDWTTKQSKKAEKDFISFSPQEKTGSIPTKSMSNSFKAKAEPEITPTITKTTTPTKEYGTKTQITPTSEPPLAKSTGNINNDARFQKIYESLSDTKNSQLKNLRQQIMNLQNELKLSQAREEVERQTKNNLLKDKHEIEKELNIAKLEVINKEKMLQKFEDEKQTTIHERNSLRESIIDGEEETNFFKKQIIVCFHFFDMICFFFANFTNFLQKIVKELDNFKGEDFSSVFFDVETPDSKQIVRAMRSIEKLQKKIMEITNFWKEREGAKSQMAEESNNKRRALIDMLQKKDDELHKLKQFHASREAQSRYESIQKDKEKPKVQFLVVFFQDFSIFLMFSCLYRCLWSQS